jgi:hypothetical protein
LSYFALDLSHSDAIASASACEVGANDGSDCAANGRGAIIEKQAMMQVEKAKIGGRSLIEGINHFPFESLSWRVVLSFAQRKIPGMNPLSSSV